MAARIQELLIEVEVNVNRCLRRSRLSIDERGGVFPAAHCIERRLTKKERATCGFCSSDVSACIDLYENYDRTLYMRLFG
jgi:hypothetical protein